MGGWWCLLDFLLQVPCSNPHHSVLIIFLKHVLVNLTFAKFMSSTELLCFYVLNCFKLLLKRWHISIVCNATFRFNQHRPWFPIEMSYPPFHDKHSLTWSRIYRVCCPKKFNLRWEMVSYSVHGGYTRSVPYLRCIPLPRSLKIHINVVRDDVCPCFDRNRHDVLWYSLDPYMSGRGRLLSNNLFVRL